MRQLLLTGIGNALVDVEFTITEEELTSFGVPKGMMTLTEPSRQKEILSALDHYVPKQSSGGSVANSIIAFAQFGGNAGFMSVLGSDALGRFYAQEFEALKIVLRAEALGGADTGSCVVMITPDGERTLNTTLAANLSYRRSMIDEQVVKNSEWVLLEGYKLTEENGAESLDFAAFTARKHGTRVAVSCSDKFIVDVFGDQLRSILRNADMIFCNESEGSALAQEESAEASFAALKSRYSNVALTRGTSGSFIHWFGNDANIPSFEVKTIDTTGAGDMYAGAFLYAALNRYSLEHAGRLASYSSAQVVAQYGARLKANHIVVRDTVLKNTMTVE